MAEQSQSVDERRVTKTVIRRRKKATPAPTEVEAQQVAAETKEESAPVQTETPVDAVPLAAEAKETTSVAQTEIEQKKTSLKVETTEAATEAEKKAEKGRALRKPSLKRRSRADLLMEEYEKAGGLKKAGELSTEENDSAQSEPMERVFQPEKRQRRGKRVIGKKDFKKTAITTPSAHKRKLRINQEIVVGDLAQAMAVKSKDVMAQLISLGSPVAINQSIDFDTAELLAHEFGFEVENISFKEEDVIPVLAQHTDKAAPTESRAPVVTVMGHVDHGKTSLLDYIRNAKVAESEAGGITQHIGAYRITTDKGDIAFIDTPGHEAFTAMRARGAKITDIVILVVAADDGVKPQTIEAINHAKAAGVPVVVAINKIDKSGINIDNVKKELSEQGLVAEDWGGEVIMVPVSALSGEGVESLLEMVALQAEVLDLRANPSGPGVGYILEAKLEKGRGPVATVMVKDGQFNKGDIVVAGEFGGRIRAMHVASDKTVDVARAATPVEITGLSGVPLAGDEIHAVKSDADMKMVISHRKDITRRSMKAAKRPASLEELYAQVEAGEKAEVKIVLKADVQGSVEAIVAALEKLGTDKATAKIIHSSVGAISESDVMLAQASQGLIIGFNVRPDNKARKAAEISGVTIKVYRVIYELIDEVKMAMVGLLEPTYEEEYLGRAEVREVYNISKLGAIAGSSVVDGKIIRACNIRVLRDGTIVYDGKLGSLRRFKDDAKEVAQGYECGIGVENFNDIKIGDVLEAYRLKEMPGEL